MNGLKKIFVLVFLVISVLTACNPSSSTLSFSEIDNVPSKVQEKVDPHLDLQLIDEYGKGYYIVFHSSGEVEADLETIGDKVTIKFNGSNQQDDDVVKQNIFYLTTDPEHDVIEVLINGKSKPFDVVTVL